MVDKEESVYKSLMLVTRVVELSHRKDIPEISKELGVSPDLVNFVLQFSQDVFSLYKETKSVRINLMPSGALDIPSEVKENYAIAKKELVRETLNREGQLTEEMANKIAEIVTTHCNKKEAEAILSDIQEMEIVASKDRLKSVEILNKMLNTTQSYLKVFTSLQEKWATLQKMQRFVERIVTIIRRHDVNIAEKVQKELAADIRAISGGGIE